MDKLAENTPLEDLAEEYGIDANGIAALDAYSKLKDMMEVADASLSSNSTNPNRSVPSV